MVIPSPKRRQHFLLTLINKFVNSMFVNKKILMSAQGVRVPFSACTPGAPRFAYSGAEGYL
ncbi:hypothetical protein ETAE_2325 [Edwardsiella piscicida]|uniref:Uncharacterized protein n=1 Tax=Edwardsiella piscicida TaxID=1263550 RepID=A0AAU8P4S4_EDWPI|nr:hypothetical protein ETAE_2325 [Edwardsiella tarda EIB202]